MRSSVRSHATWMLLLVCASFTQHGLSDLETVSMIDNSRGGTDLSCAVMIWGNQDYEWEIVGQVNGGAVTSHCIDSVKLARDRCGGSGLNFVVTHFWRYQNATNDPEQFCYKTNKGDDQIPVECTPLVDWNPGNLTLAGNLVQRFQQGMKYCFLEAIRYNFTKLKITPHLDDGTGKGGWRNVLRLHPFRRLEGWSYSDIMLRPLARAMHESLEEMEAAPFTEVYFTLQGEMNLALAAFPGDWQFAINETREIIAGDDPIRQANVKVGVSMNFNKLCGSYCDPAKNLASNSTTATVPNSVLAQIDMDEYKKLLYAVDFLGISDYPRVWDSYQKGWMDLESSARQLDQEMQEAFGIDLKTYINSGKEFHLSEFGMGGGKSQCGCQPATDVETVADFTFFGLFGIYGHFPDPWKNETLREFRKEFFESSLRWLRNKGGPAYRVDGAYLWCMSSWDVAGLYWTSYSAKGSYYDPEVMEMIKDWNDKRQLP